MVASSNSDDLVISISTDTSELVNAQKNASKAVIATLESIEKAAIQAGSKIDKAFIDAGDAMQKGVGSGAQGAKSALKSMTDAFAKQEQALAKVKAEFPAATKAVEQYETAVNSLKASFVAGDSTAKDFLQGLELERKALLVNTAEMRKNQNALLARNKAAASGRVQSPANSNVAGVSEGARRFQTADIAAQFQDIAVTSAMGMNPIQIALQQGTQLSSVLSTMGSGRQVVAGLASAFASLVSPVSLVTIGLTAGAAALITYISNLKSGGSRSEEVLKKEAELIQKVVDKWGDATPALKKYNDERERLANAKDISDAAAAGIEQQWDKARAKIDELVNKQAAAISDLMTAGADPSKLSAAQAAWNKLASGIDKHTASADDARNAQRQFADFATSTGIPSVTELAKAFDGLDTILNQVNKSASQINLEGRLAAGMASAREYEIASLAALEKLKTANADYMSGQERRLAMSKEERDIAEEIARIQQEAKEKGAVLPYNQARDLAVRRLAADQPPTVTDMDGVTRQVPVPGQRPLYEIEGAGDDAKKAQSAREKLAEAYKSQIEDAKNRNDQLRMEIELQGLGTKATDAARVSLEMLQKAQKAGITGENLENIKKQAAAYQQLADTLAKTKLSQDLANQNWMASLSTNDQRVAQTLKQYGLPVDLNSQQAGQIRQFNGQQDERDAITSFLTDFKGDIVSSGGDIGKSFAESFRNALLSQADKLWSSAFRQIANMLVGGSTQPAAAGGNILGLGVSTVSRLTAPSSLSGMSGDMAIYAAATRSIESGGNYRALGPVLASGDRAYGAYQVMGANIPSWTKAATGSALTQQQFLASSSAQDAVFNKYFGAALSKYGNPQDAASVWFSGRPLSAAGNASDGFNTTPEYLTKFNAAIGDATKNVGSFGSDLGKVASNVIDMKPAGAGAGSLASGIPSAVATPVDTSAVTQATSGIGGMLTSITSGIGGFLSKILSGIGSGFGGLLSGVFKLFGFAEGGYTGSGGKHEPAGIVHGGEFVFSKGAVDRIGVANLNAIHRTAKGYSAGGFVGRLPGYADGGLVAPAQAPRLRPRVAATNDNGSNPGTLNVHITGASGDAHIRSLVQQGVSSGLAQYNVQQERGGWGSQQSKYQNMKA